VTSKALHRLAAVKSRSVACVSAMKPVSAAKSRVGTRSRRMAVARDIEVVVPAMQAGDGAFLLYATVPGSARTKKPLLQEQRTMPCGKHGLLVMLDYVLRIREMF
jgi:hypothetical protein